MPMRGFLFQDQPDFLDEAGFDLVASAPEPERDKMGGFHGYPMAPRTQEKDPQTPAGRMAGFVRFEWYLLLSLVLIGLALALPRLARGDGRGALAALLGEAAVVTGLLALLLLATWLGQSRMAPFLGMVGRLLLTGGIGLVLGTALAAGHGSRGESLAGSGGALLLGGLGLYLHRRLGADRFWSGFRWFCLALLGSLAGGILGILGPEPWSVPAGILAPLALFALIAGFSRSAGGGSRAG